MKRIVKALICFAYKIKFLRKCRIHAASSVLLRGCTFEGSNSLGERVFLSRTSMGYGSYTGFSCEFSNCKIGRFCSIGNLVRVVDSTHPTDMISTYPAFYSDTFKKTYVKQSKYSEHLITSSGAGCEIGNDVWIGDNVLIRGGVTIGDGAIIAMGSIVLHDVAPYTIVGGAPAKEIRTRFDEETIEELETFRWWDKPMSWIKAHAEEFSDPQVFLENNCNNERRE